MTNYTYDRLILHSWLGESWSDYERISGTLFDITLTDDELEEREAWAQHLETMDPPEEWEFEAELEQWENRQP